MKRSPAQATKPFHFYDQGWNARVRGEPFRSSLEGSSRSWRDGWKDCDEAPAEDRKEI